MQLLLLLSGLPTLFCSHSSSEPLETVAAELYRPDAFPVAKATALKALKGNNRLKDIFQRCAFPPPTAINLPTCKHVLYGT